MSDAAPSGRDRFDRYYQTPAGTVPEGGDIESALRKLETFLPQGGSQRVSGSSHVGSVVATEFKASGSVHVEQDVRAGSFSLSGSGQVHGDLLSKEVQASGSLRVGGAVTAVRCRFSGSASADGGLCAREAIEASGSLKAAWVASRGDVSVSGRIEASTVQGRSFDLAGGGAVHTVSAETVSINDGRKGWARVGFLGSKKSTRFHADSVSATREVRVDQAEIGLVRAPMVHIGKHAKIGRVEYSERCDVEEGATLGAPPVKTPPA